MRTINELNAQITALLDKAEKIEADAVSQDRILSDDEAEQVASCNADAKALIEERDALDRRLQLKAERDELRAQFRGEDKEALPSHAVTRNVRESLLDDPKRGFANLGDFAAAVYDARGGDAFIDKRLRIGAAATGASYGDGSSLGFLLPPEFSTTIWDGMNTGAESLLSMTDSFPVSGESLTFPGNAETSRANGSRYGGVRGYWLEEAEQVTSSAPKVRRITIEPQELGVLIYGTDKLLKNTAAAERYLRQAATEEISFMVGDAIVNGDGVGKPKGLMNSGCKVEVAKETSQAGSTIVHANILKMWSRLHPRSRSTAVWLANVDVEPELDNLFLPVTDVAGSENVGGRDQRIRSPESNTLKGRPVIYTEYNQTLGTAGDLILVDLKSYLTGVRGGVDSAMSIHLRFDYAETAFRFMFAVDGQTWMDSAITPKNGSNTLTSVVTLATRS